MQLSVAILQFSPHNMVKTCFLPLWLFSMLPMPPLGKLPFYYLSCLINMFYVGIVITEIGYKFIMTKAKSQAYKQLG